MSVLQLYIMSMTGSVSAAKNFPISTIQSSIQILPYNALVECKKKYKKWHQKNYVLSWHGSYFKLDDTKIDLYVCLLHLVTNQ